ncbi:MAG: hypothetical protein J5I81_09590 [Nitrococcus mobilis]|nr:hypothetical protein [Nitrococcus mobilis]
MRFKSALVNIGLELRHFAAIRFGNNVSRRVFCIGPNKSGTTSLGAFLASAGFRVAPQSKGEMLLHDWARGDFRRLIKLCRQYEAFQDVPFSYPNTYRALFEAFPDTKFILTKRNSAEEWYQSVIRFHAKIVGKGRVPTADDLKAFPYRYVGWLWDAQRLRYGIDEQTLYDPEIYKAAYRTHLKEAVAYFSDKPGHLLEVNLSDPQASEKILEFLELTDLSLQMPHLNQTG